MEQWVYDLQEQLRKEERKHKLVILAINLFLGAVVIFLLCFYGLVLLSL